MVIRGIYKCISLTAEFFCLDCFAKVVKQLVEKNIRKVEMKRKIMILNVNLETYI